MLRNRATEADIRCWLSKNGYYGRSAKFNEIELHAIRRPGWLQVYRFECEAKSIADQRWISLWGAVIAVIAVCASMIGVVMMARWLFDPG